MSSGTKQLLEMKRLQLWPPLIFPSMLHPLMYAALLTPQWRFLYDLFLYRPCRSDEKLNHSDSGPGPRSDEPFTLLADVDAYVVDEIYLTASRDTG